MEQDLVPKFSDKYESALSLLESSNLQAAKYSYQELMGIYSQISDSSLDPVHKQLAYNCVVDLYNKLHDVSGDSTASKLTMGFIATAVILAILAVIIILKPSIVGLTALDMTNSAPVWSGDTIFKVSSVEGMLEVDLGVYFSDADWDDLTYISTQTENLTVEVVGDILTLMPNPGYVGTQTITVIASDMQAFTKVPVSVVIG
jgi:hypothetical protein